MLHVRHPVFGLEPGLSGLWNPTRPELSHTLNAFQLALPYLEPYFIDAIKQASVYVTDPALKADAVAFCAQEANHSREHKRYCRLLHERYPRLAELEANIRQSLVESRRRDSLEWRLAYTAGYEAITVQLARLLFQHSTDWFSAGSDAGFPALLMWHAAEEIEHRHVAFDVLRCVTRRYDLRLNGLTRAISKTYADMNPAISYMLEVDGYRGLSSTWRRLQVRSLIAKDMVPAVIRYALPGYHPSKEHAPEGYNAWLRAHPADGEQAAAE
jgi:predicted metal-dependent hydrolase